MIKKTAFLMTTVLTVATVLTVGLTVLPGSVQEAQANPCSELSIAAANSEVNGAGGMGDDELNVGDLDSKTSPEIDCDLTGVVIDEIVTVEEDRSICANGRGSRGSRRR